MPVVSCVKTYLPRPLTRRLYVSFRLAYPMRISASSPPAFIPSNSSPARPANREPPTSRSARHLMPLDVWSCGGGLRRDSSIASFVFMWHSSVSLSWLPVDMQTPGYGVKSLSFSFPRTALADPARSPGG